MQPVRLRLEIDAVTAIRAGQREHGAAVVELEPALLSERQREALVSLSRARGDGEFEIRGELAQAVPKLAEASAATARTVLDAIADALDAQRQKAAAQQVLLERVARAMADQWLSIPDDELLYIANWGDWQYRDPTAKPYAVVERLSGNRFALGTSNLELQIGKVQQEIGGLKAKQQRLAAECRERNERRAAEAKARVAEAKARSAEAAARKQAQLDDWVRDHGTASQQRRHARGLLGEEEIVDGLREAAFAPLRGERQGFDFPRYKRLTRDDVLDALDDDYPSDDDAEVEYSSGEKAEASESEFATLEAIEAALVAVHGKAAVRVVLRSHKGGLKAADDWAVERTSVLATLTLGELELSREYAMAE